MASLVTVTCIDCNKERTVDYRSRWLIRTGQTSGRCFSCAAKLRPQSKLLGGKPDEANTNWKGDGVGMTALHAWVRRRLGKPLECWECGKKGGTTHNFHWANLSHTYKRDVSDYARLCVSCHKLYDLGKLELSI